MEAEHTPNPETIAMESLVNQKHHQDEAARFPRVILLHLKRGPESFFTSKERP
jgi:hypothetical protein